MSKRLFISLALITGAAVSALAQTFQDGFFLRSSLMSYRYNPALVPENGFIGAGGLMIQDYRDFGLSTFLYPRGDGKLVTYLHSSVSSDEARDRLNTDNYFLKSLNLNVISYGLRRGEAMHTFELNARGVIGLSFPGEPFMFLKTGTFDSTRPSRLRGEAELYMELAYGYSRRLGEKLSLGGRLKLLAGFYGVDYNVTRLNLTMNDQTSLAEIEAELNLTDKMYKISAGDDGYLDWRTIARRAPGSPPSGGGAALDLGINYAPVDGLELSASVLDLGGILWRYGNAATSSGSVDLTLFNDLSLDEMNKEGLKSQLSRLKDDALNSLELTPSKKLWKWKRVPLSANAAVRYAMPFYDRLSVGVTGNYTSYQWMPYWEARAGMGVQPLDWLEMTANLGTGAFGMVWGLAGSFRVENFHFTVGMNNGFGGRAPDSRWTIKANKKLISFGIMYDLSGLH